MGQIAGGKTVVYTQYFIVFILKNGFTVNKSLPLPGYYLADPRLFCLEIVNDSPCFINFIAIPEYREAYLATCGISNSFC